MGKVIGNAQQRLKPGCCLQLCVITVVEKEETLLNRTPCPPGNFNYCLYWTAVSNQLCDGWDFVLFGRTLLPPDGFFSVILQRRTFFWVPFSIFLFFFKKKGACLLCTANTMQVTASSCARRRFCPLSASLWSQDLSEMLKDVSLAGPRVPTQASVLNTITVNIQQLTASSSSESQP